MSENKSKDNMRGNRGFQADSTSSVRNVIQKCVLIQTYMDYSFHICPKLRGADQSCSGDENRNIWIKWWAGIMAALSSGTSKTSKGSDVTGCPTQNTRTRKRHCTEENRSLMAANFSSALVGQQHLGHCRGSLQKIKGWARDRDTGAAERDTRSVTQLYWFCCKWLTTAYWSACCLNEGGGWEHWKRWKEKGGRIHILLYYNRL